MDARESFLKPFYDDAGQFIVKKAEKKTEPDIELKVPRQQIAKIAQSTGPGILNGVQKNSCAEKDA